MSDQPFDQHDSTQSTKDVAKEESKNVSQDAKQSAESVAQTAGTEAKQVAGEAKAQAVSLYEQVREDVSGQAKDQQQRAAGGLHGLADELTKMAEGDAASGMATGLARQAAERVDAVGSWLENREPRDLLDEVRRYARRNPGTFLAACATIGFVGGRLTRGLREDADEQQARRDQRALTPGYTEGYAPAYGEPVTTSPQAYGGRPGAGEPAVTYAAGGTAPVAGQYEEELYTEGTYAEGSESPYTEGTGTSPFTEGTDTSPYTEGGERR